jgi:hypothetical protein
MSEDKGSPEQNDTNRPPLLDGSNNVDKQQAVNRAFEIIKRHYETRALDAVFEAKLEKIGILSKLEEIGVLPDLGDYELPADQLPEDFSERFYKREEALKLIYVGVLLEQLFGGSPSSSR